MGVMKTNRRYIILPQEHLFDDKGAMWEWYPSLKEAKKNVKNYDKAGIQVVDVVVEFCSYTIGFERTKEINK